MRESRRRIALPKLPDRRHSWTSKLRRRPRRYKPCSRSDRRDRCHRSRPPRNPTVVVLSNAARVRGQRRRPKRTPNHTRRRKRHPMTSAPLPAEQRASASSASKPDIVAPPPVARRNYAPAETTAPSRRWWPVSAQVPIVIAPNSPIPTATTQSNVGAGVLAPAFDSCCKVARNQSKRPRPCRCFPHATCGGNSDPDLFGAIFPSLTRRTIIEGTVRL